MTGATLRDTSNTMQRGATVRDDSSAQSSKGFLISGKQYFSASDLAREIGVSRQTLWRWRQNGKIPKGHRFRDNRIFFTVDEVECVREFANRIEAADVADGRQGKLFSGPSRRNQ